MKIYTCIVLLCLLSYLFSNLFAWRYAFTLDTVDNKYRFGALPGDAAVLSQLYGESVSRNQTLPPYKATPAELKKQKPIVAEMVDQAVLFVHAMAATQGLAKLMEETEVRASSLLSDWLASKFRAGASMDITDTVKDITGSDGGGWRSSKQRKGERLIIEAKMSEVFASIEADRRNGVQHRHTLQYASTSKNFTSTYRNRIMTASAHERDFILRRASEDAAALSRNTTEAIENRRALVSCNRHVV